MEAGVAKYMVKATYLGEGARGLAKEGGSSRRSLVQKMVEGVGGRMESFYYAYGETDAYIICDMPDAASGLAISMAVNASGAVRVSLVPLITPEEIDAAVKKIPAYRAPGA
jgi:uncharacterized protein with GYD domain